MLTFYTTDFEGHWPVGAAAICSAKDEREARRGLDAAIKDRGLDPMDGGEYTENGPTTYVIKQLNPGETVILLDGNY